MAIPGENIPGRTLENTAPNNSRKLNLETKRDQFMTALIKYQYECVCPY
jgi:hypothetical protein